MKTIIVYEKRDTVKFKYRGKVKVGQIVGKWAKGEGDGYDIITTDNEYEVLAKNIIGLAKG
jgi:inosine/xanthosine triphosphate pyrophosphatase family protein